MMGWEGGIPHHLNDEIRCLYYSFFFNLRRYLEGDMRMMRRQGSGAGSTRMWFFIPPLHMLIRVEGFSFKPFRI